LESEATAVLFNSWPRTRLAPYKFWDVRIYSGPSAARTCGPTLRVRFCLRNNWDGPVQADKPCYRFLRMLVIRDRVITFGTPLKGVFYDNRTELIFLGERFSFKRLSAPHDAGGRCLWRLKVIKINGLPAAGFAGRDPRRLI